MPYKTQTATRCRNKILRICRVCRWNVRHPTSTHTSSSLASAPLLGVATIHTPIVSYTNICPWHQPLSRAFRLLLDVLPVDLVALLGNEAHQRQPNQECAGQQDDVYGDGIVVEGEMGRSVEARLREVEDARETDDEAIDLAKGCETEDFGRVVTRYMSDVACHVESSMRLTKQRCSIAGDIGRRE